MTTQLTSEDHQKVRKLILEFEKGDDDTKQVYIRDGLDEIFAPHLMQWRLLPKQIGIHTENRDHDMMSPAGVWLRGGKINNSGFSPLARGKVWAFEDHPIKKHIEKHTLAVTSADKRFGSYQPGDVKVGPANWTHSNQFVCMVMDRTPCDYSGLPCRDGHIDSDAITQDPKNVRLAEYIAQGMNVFVFPHWVEEQYPAIPRIFQSACNQEQQVQEGVGLEFNYMSIILFYLFRILVFGVCISMNSFFSVLCFFDTFCMAVFVFGVCVCMCVFDTSFGWPSGFQHRASSFQHRCLSFRCVFFDIFFGWPSCHPDRLECRIGFFYLR